MVAAQKVGCVPVPLYADAAAEEIAYSSYQELSQHPRVLDTIQTHVAEVNKSVTDDPMLAGCQVHRFLVLHKELDADDGFDTVEKIGGHMRPPHWYTYGVCTGSVRNLAVCNQSCATPR